MKIFENKLLNILNKFLWKKELIILLIMKI